MDSEDIDGALKHLIELGLVGIEYDENLEARFFITEEGVKALRGQPDV